MFQDHRRELDKNRDKQMRKSLKDKDVRFTNFSYEKVNVGLQIMRSFGLSTYALGFSEYMFVKLEIPFLMLCYLLTYIL